MAAAVAPLQPLKLPSGPSPTTPEQRYWRSFKSQQLIPTPHSSPVTHVSHPNAHLLGSSPSSSSPSDLFAVTSGNRIRIFSSRTRKLTKTISRFGVSDIAHSGELRPSDSAAVVAGGDSGAVQVFRTESRAILKTWTEHKLPVWSTKWSPTDPTALLSTSDDRTVKLWNLSESESMKTFTGHQDYVRSAAFLPGHNSSHIFATGSYDQTVRLWDARTPDPSRAIMTFMHAAPVESLLPLPSPSGAASTTLLTAAGTSLSVLDLTAARPLEILDQHHQKTITSLSLASNGTRLLTASLDGHMKVLDTSTWRLVAGSKYPAPILALAAIPAGSQMEDRHLAVGLQSGLFSLKTRLSGPLKAIAKSKAAEMTALEQGTIEEYDKKKARQERLKGATQGVRKRLRGLDDEGQGAEIVVEGRERTRRKKLQPWDEALRAGRYAKALDHVLVPQQQKQNRTRNGAEGKGGDKKMQGEAVDTTAVLTLLLALHHRSALRSALSERTAGTLTPVLRFLIRTIVDPRHVGLVCMVSGMVLDLYAHEMGRSSEVDGLIEKLHERVREGVEGAQVAGMVGGLMGVVRAGAG